MALAVGTEEDGKMIVETELVETDGQQLLPVSQQVGQQAKGIVGMQQSMNIGLVSGNGKHAESGTEASNYSYEGSAEREMQNASGGKEGFEASELKISHGIRTMTGQPLHDTLSHHEMHSHTNPLSTHTSSGALRNKKSSLLIDYTIAEEVGANSANRHMDTDSDITKCKPQTTSTQAQQPIIQLLQPQHAHVLQADMICIPNPDVLQQQAHLQPQDVFVQQIQQPDENPQEQTYVQREQGDEVLPSQNLVADSSTRVRQSHSPVQMRKHHESLDQKQPIDSSISHHVLTTDVVPNISNAVPDQNEHINPSVQPSSNVNVLKPTSSGSESIQTGSNSQFYPTQNDTDSIKKLNKEPSSKADFFAARLATAVGENEISDSEETFVYQSTANSVKNGSLKESFTTTNNAVNLLQSVPGSKTYGIPSKLSVPQLKQQDKLLNRLKNTRHTSIAAIPTSQGTVSTTSEKDDLSSLRSMNRTSVQEIQSIKSHRTQMSESPRKRLSIASFSKSQNRLQPKQSQPISNHTVGTNNGNSQVNPSPPTRAILGTNNKRASTINNGKVHQSKQSRQKIEQEPDYRIKNKSNARSQVKQKKSLQPLNLRGPRLSGVPGRSNTQTYYTGDESIVDNMEQYDGDHESLINKYMSREMNRSRGYTNQQVLTPHSQHFPNRRSNHFESDEITGGYEEETYEDHEGDEDLNESDNSSGLSDLNRLDYDDMNNYDEVSFHDADGDGEDEHDDIQSMFYYQGNSNNQQSRPGRRFSNFDEDMDEDLEAQTFFYGNQHHGRELHPNMERGSELHPFFLHANEYTPLQRKTIDRKKAAIYSDYSPHNFYTKKSSWAKFKNFIYFCFIISSMLTLGFISGFLIATNKDLHDFQIFDIDNVLVSTDELVFDILATGFNPGIFTIGIRDVELDIFAKSSHLKSQYKDNADIPAAPYQTILLGTVYSLETELKFRGRFINRNYDVSIASIKLLSPGAPNKDTSNDNANVKENDINFITNTTAENADGQTEQEGFKPDNDIDRWKQLIKYEFELIIRGNMYYTIPFFNSKRVISVQQQKSIDPTDSG